MRMLLFKLKQADLQAKLVLVIEVIVIWGGHQRVAAHGLQLTICRMQPVHTGQGVYVVQTHCLGKCGVPAQLIESCPVADRL